ncbi:MAG TPA: glycosyltransferase [Ottowia sp.]|uniref:glycosyltransferase n=1 Tax=Ottowia sp. TaxID=1898956 RepID=UPI002B5C733C|nr:glycosyltransferase [Ottowia sp.]HMN20930.1 glycosyltransferase [Ottowia sp.]
MHKATIAIFTSTFPYYPGEQFIEPEIAHWSNLDWAHVVLCPYTARGDARSVPDDIEIFIGRRGQKLHKLWCAALALKSALFWRELHYLRSIGKLSLATASQAIRAVANTLAATAKMRQISHHLGHIDIAYCYWNAEQAYAACLLKRQGKISTVLSRAHRFDLYEQRRPREYMPLKRQFISDFDVVYAISEQGRRYLADTYGFSEDRLSVSRLGVNVAKPQARASGDGVSRMLSVSFCVPVKRIDLIIDAIYVVAKMQPNRRFEWAHIGDGPLRAELETLAKKRLSTLSNVDWRFTGMLSNENVLSFYDENPVDIFINCSESEGVPVSIMEAMAHGVPAIAPRVGGIPELVDATCGELLSLDFKSTDVAAAIARLTGEEALHYRLAARGRVSDLYNASKNFSGLVADVKKLSEVALTRRSDETALGRV